MDLPYTDLIPGVTGCEFGSQTVPGGGRVPSAKYFRVFSIVQFDGRAGEQCYRPGYEYDTSLALCKRYD